MYCGIVEAVVGRLHEEGIECWAGGNVGAVGTTNPYKTKIENWSYKHNITQYVGRKLAHC